MGLVGWSLAWASPIRLSGRGMEPPATRRHSRTAYQRDRSDRPHMGYRATGKWLSAVIPLLTDVMTNDFLKDILLFALGAIVALVGAGLKAWLDRGTYVSNKIFDERLSSLNALWLKFNDVRAIFLQRIPLGYDNWRSRHYSEAERVLYEFRTAIDRSQMIVDSEIIAAFRSVHEFLFLLKDNKAQEPEAFTSELGRQISKLSDKVNSTMAKRNHKISLQLST